MELLKLTETCYMTEDCEFALVQPINETNWVILNKNIDVLFGLDTFENQKEIIDFICKVE